VNGVDNIKDRICLHKRWLDSSLQLVQDPISSSE
jgi:hypothetical protein